MKILAATLWMLLIAWVGIDRYQQWKIPAKLVTADHQIVQQEELLFIDYLDARHGFSMVVPKGWARNIDAQLKPNLDSIETGYSAVFESALQGSDDPYTDYIMVELLPGIETGAFETTGENREVVIVDGQKAVQDELTLVNFPMQHGVVDLVVKQAEIAQLGYTVGLFAIGTKNNAWMLEDAFQAMLHSFQLPRQPYLITDAGQP